MVNKRWILSGVESLPDMDPNRMWMDDQGGGQEMDLRTEMTINPLSL